jgi:calcium-translocating P-type ATPase
MRITDYIASGGCVILSDGQTAQGVFRKILSLPSTGIGLGPVSGEAVVNELCATLEAADLGNGVALPHARLDEISDPLLFIALIPEGIPSRKKNAPRLRLLFIFFTPTKQTDIHLKLLAHLAWIAGRSGLIAAATACAKPQDLMVALRSIESSGKGRFVSLDRQAIFEELKTGPEGLTDAEAARRREITGKNIIRKSKRVPAILKLGKNFVSVFAILLWIAGALCFLPGVDMPQLGWAIFAVIVVNATFAFWQENKAERAVEALQNLIPEDCVALRDGKKTRMPVTDLVYGDVIFLEEGNRIPVDARLIEADALRVNNAILTGESRPIYKMAEPLSGNEESWFLWTDLPNMVFAGTSVAAGAGIAVVCGTAMGTEIGRIASLTQSVRVGDSPLQKEIKGLVNLLTALSLGIGIAFFFLGAFLGGLSYLGAFVFMIGITVANIPEGLLPTMSLALAMGVQRMARKNVLVKNLASVETLGSTTVICTDKTGTLTTNRISVVRLIVGEKEVAVPSGDGLNGTDLNGDPRIRLLLRVAVLCNNSRPGFGDPTELALFDLAERFGFDWSAEQAGMPRLFSNPFDSVRKRMSTVNRAGDGRAFACVKGSPLELLAHCTTIADGKNSRPLTQEDRERIRASVDAFAGDGLRTLAFAYKDLSDENPEAAHDKEDLESGLCFLGITGMEDPPRPEVPAAIASCRSAGIRLVMITGDYGLTALSIARHVGMIGPEDRPEECLLSGQDLEKLGDEALLHKLAGGGPLIVARTDPEQKMRIVSCLNELGEVVAVTGDGVNDAAALKKADIGIAMGREVNDVAKEAADMIVLDGNFASISSAIEEGRAVYANIRRFSTYVLASNMPELAPFILFVLLKIPLALTVMQILAIDLGTDLVPALGLGAEVPEPGVMDRPPRKKTERLLNVATLIRAYAWLGGMEIVLSLGAFFYAYWSRGFGFFGSLPMEGFVYRFATTMTLAGIVTCQIGNVFGCRTSRQSIFKVGFASNRLVLVGIAVEVCLILALVYVPFLQSVFSLAPLSIFDWAFVATFPFIMLGLEELRKLVVRLFAA